MKQYAYRVYNLAKGIQIGAKVGGVTHADSIDDVVRKVIDLCDITVVTLPMFLLTPEKSNFYMGEEKVGIVVYARPEDYIAS